MSLRAIKQEVLRLLAEAYVDSLKDAIDKNQALGPPLAASTQARKGHGTKWLDFGDLKGSLVATRIDSERWHGGVREGSLNRNGQPLDLIALANEIGSLTIEARPLFEPVAERMWKSTPEQLGIPLESLVKKAFG